MWLEWSWRGEVGEVCCGREGAEDYVQGRLNVYTMMKRERADKMKAKLYISQSYRCTNREG